MKKNALLLLILILASFLRLWKLSSVPPSASLDETSIGWNAYSILKTGTDEYGTKFPILLRAYDDWRPALYVYLVIPFVQLLGLNIVAVRLPAALLSILTVLATYFLAKTVVDDPQYHVGYGASLGRPKAQLAGPLQFVPLLVMLLFAISPWHIYISRLGHEANTGLAFLVFGILFFLKDRINLSSIFMALSLISYQSQKVIIPILLLGMLTIFRRNITKNKIKYTKAVLLALLILIPFIVTSLQPDALIRFKATSIFNENHGGIMNDLRIVVKQYLSHFNLKWLFFNSGRDAHKVPNLGLLYLWELPLIIVGGYIFLRSNIARKVKALTIVWFLSAPLPAAITTQAPHAMRSYTFLPVWQILSAFGGIYIIHKLWRLRVVIGILFITIISLSLVSFYANYFVVFPQEQSDSFQYALHRAVGYVLEKEAEYDKIVFSNENNLYQSYMFFLFNSRYNPKQYQKLGGTVSGGFAETHKIDKYEFRPIEWNSETEKALYIGNVSDFPEDISTLYISSNLNRQPAIKVVEK